MKKPDARVVGLEAQDKVARGRHDDGVAAHGHRGEVGHVAGVPVARVVVAAVDDLERVPVQVEGVLARVVVVQDDVDRVLVVEDKGLGVVAVHGRVGGIVAGGQGGEERRDFGRCVGDVVEECAYQVLAIKFTKHGLRTKTGKEEGLLVGAITKVVHGQVERDSVVSIRV